MDALELEKIKLLSESKNLLNLLDSEDRWQEFSVMNNAFQSSLKKSFDRFGDQLQSVYPELMKDNDLIQERVKQLQVNLLQNSQKDLKNLKNAQAYFDSVKK